METKICFKCGQELSIDNFYKHPQMADGHLNKCKECTKQDVHKDYDRKIINPEWRESEKARARDKYHRLYTGVKRSPDKKREDMKRYKEKYPEKYMAQNRAAQIPKADGLERHHWSYNEEHWTDVINLSATEHMKLHRYMIYDQERMMYRTTVGVLLDTREAHMEYYNAIRDLQ